MGEVKQNISIDRHVAVLAFPFATHSAPLLAVVSRLAASSPSTHFSFINTAQFNQSIFPSEPNKQPPNISARHVSDGVPDGYVSVGKPQEHIELFLNSAPERFREEIKAAESEIGKKVNCLVTDAFFWFAAEMASDMEVPWVPFWTAGPGSLSAHVHTDVLRKSFGIEGITGKEKEEHLKLIPGMSKVQIRDLPEGIVFGNLESVFSCMLQKMGAVLPQADAVFLNSFEELDLTMTEDFKSKFKKHLNIGPFNLISPSPSDDPYGCIPWLDQQKIGSVAYVSFGSVTTPPPHEIAALAEGLEASRVPFVWSLKENAKVHLPDGFLDKALNGMIVPWAPQSEILGHGGIGVFVTHGGWNSLMESVGGGVPLICRPFFGDQRLNSRMVEDVWEIGVIVEGGVFTKEGVVSGLDQIISKERGGKLRGNIKVLKELAVKAIEPKGSSTRNFLALSHLVLGTHEKS